ncbi:MAG TPA: hypothetical protein VMZ33_03655 [Candidatus Limnocylindrales bacterium]|nr:hypothetical protein [Candidatus Limnocylindrales bacterium]
MNGRVGSTAERCVPGSEFSPVKRFRRGLANTMPATTEPTRSSRIVAKNSGLTSALTVVSAASLVAGATATAGIEKPKINAGACG